jgi:flagellar motor protein MotB
MFGKKDSSPNIWMSYADLLTGSLIVFMVITVVLVIKVNSRIENATTITAKNFKDKLKPIPGVDVTDEGIIRLYSEGEKELFKTNKYNLTEKTKELIKKVWPVFLEEIIDKYKDEKIEIFEIRIEGHTDSRPANDTVIFGNLGLSQLRAAETWIFIRDSLINVEIDSLKSVSTGYKKRKKDLSRIQDIKILTDIEKRMVTVGFGARKPLNGGSKLLIEDGGKEDENKSRRIEFRLQYGLKKSKKKE